MDTTMKTGKLTSETHKSKENLEMDHEKLYPGPKLKSRQDLVDINNNLLKIPTVKDGAHPDYSYSWLSMMPHAKPNFYEAVSKLGYTACTMYELKEMWETYRDYKKIDNSLGGDKIIVNEMILCKVHKQDKALILAENHHHKPNEMARDVYRNFVNKVQDSGGGARTLSEAELRIPGDEDSGTERVFRGQATTGRLRSGIAIEGNDLRTYDPNVNHLL